MIQVLIAVALLTGAANAHAADQIQAGVVCNSLEGEPELVASLFYASHEERELFKPVYVEIVTPLPSVSQTCVMGQNRKASEASQPIQMFAVPNNPCDATEGPLAIKRLAEILGTRETGPNGNPKFQAEITYISNPGAGEIFKATLECQILPLTNP